MAPACGSRTRSSRGFGPSLRPVCGGGCPAANGFGHGTSSPGRRPRAASTAGRRDGYGRERRGPPDRPAAASSRRRTTRSRPTAITATSGTRLADRVGVRHLVGPTERRPFLGDDLAGGDVDGVDAMVGEGPGDRDRVVDRRCRPEPSRWRRSVRTSAGPRPHRTDGVEDLEREAQAVGDGPPVGVGAAVRQRRQERRTAGSRGRSAVREGRSRHRRPGRRRRRTRCADRPPSRPRTVRAGSGSPAGTPAPTGRPPASCRPAAARPCPPTSAGSSPCARSGRAGCRSWPATGRARTRRCARQPSRCSSVHRPVQPGVIRPFGETQTISVITRPAPPSALLPRCTRWKSPG